MIIIINGPCGVGKSETAEKLGSMLYRSVVLDGDYLGNVNPFEIYSKERVDHLYETFVVNIAHHQRYGFEHFIISYVFETEENLKNLLRRLQPLHPDIFTFRLYASLEENRQRIRKRATSGMEWELGRSEVLSNTMEPLGDAVGERIDVTELGLREVTELILEKIKVYEEHRLPELDFHERYINWVYNGEKQSTTRLVKNTAEPAPFKAGDYCLATNQANNMAFAVLKINVVEERSFEDLDEELARSENFQSLAEFREAVMSFYPGITAVSRFRVYRFSCVHYLDHKLKR